GISSGPGGFRPGGVKGPPLGGSPSGEDKAPGPGGIPGGGENADPGKKEGKDRSSWRPPSGTVLADAFSGAGGGFGGGFPGGEGFNPGPGRGKKMGMPAAGIPGGEGGPGFV